MISLNEIIRTALVATVLALLQNWLYDILKRRNVFPDNPKLNYFFLLVTVSLVFIVGFSASSAPTQDNPQENAQMVSTCLQTHGMQRPREMRWNESHTTQTFLECNWSPKTYSDPDGYSEIKIDFVEITKYRPTPDPSVGIVLYVPDDHIVGAARVFSSCSKLRIESTFSIQGAGITQHVVIINARTLHDISDTTTENDRNLTDVKDFIGEYDIWIDKAERNETIIIERQLHSLDYVECVE